MAVPHGQLTRHGSCEKVSRDLVLPLVALVLESRWKKRRKSKTTACGAVDKAIQPINIRFPADPDPDSGLTPEVLFGWPSWGMFSGEKIAVGTANCRQKTWGSSWRPMACCLANPHYGTHALCLLAVHCGCSPGYEKVCPRINIGIQGGQESCRGLVPRN